MVGLIQKILFDMIIAVGGQKALTEVKRLAGVPEDREFQINLVYSDEEWQRLFAAALKVLNITKEQAYDVYAGYFGEDAAKRFPTWFQMSKNSYEFLLIQPVIHNCFATGVVDPQQRAAINDKFKVEKFPNKIITHYRSSNHHCGLYKALARWVIKYYKDEAIIEDKQCTDLGDSECEIHVNWNKLGNLNAAENSSSK